MRISDWSSDVCSSDLGDNYKFEYRHDWDNLSIGLYGFRHEAEPTDSSADASTRNDVAFLGGSPTNADLQLGGSGTNTERWRNRDEFGLTAEYWLDTDFGTHTFKFGYSDTENTDKVDQRFTGPEAAQYTSISADNAGVPFADYVGGAWTGFVDLAGTNIDHDTNANATPGRQSCRKRGGQYVLKSGVTDE